MSVIFFNIDRSMVHGRTRSQSVQMFKNNLSALCEAESFKSRIILASIAFPHLNQYSSMYQSIWKGWAGQGRMGMDDEVPPIEFQNPLLVSVTVPHQAPALIGSVTMGTGDSSPIRNRMRMKCVQILYKNSMGDMN